MSNESNLQKILTELAPFSRRTHPEVLVAREILKKEFLKLKPWINERRAIVTIHGSCQYCDPVNLDADVTVVSLNMTTKDMHSLLIQTRDIEDVWPWDGGTDISVCSIGEIPYDENDGLFLALALSSDPLWEQDRTELVVLQIVAMEIFTARQDLALEVLGILDETLKIRRERTSN